MRLKTWFLLISFPLLLVSCNKDKDPLGISGVVPVDFLSDSKYQKLKVEIKYMPGYEPTETAMDSVNVLLNARLNKPHGIVYDYEEIPSGAETSYTLGEIRDIEEEYRESYTGSNTLVVFCLFVDAEYAENDQSQVLGTAYGPTSMVIFEKTIQDNSGGLGEPPIWLVEATVIEHEFGHLFGLVNNGTQMVSDHQDEAHGHHCDNSDCLMYWSTETSDVIGNLLGGDIPELDANCIDDLQANGGK